MMGTANARKPLSSRLRSGTARIPDQRSGGQDAVTPAVPWRERPLLPLRTAAEIAGVSVASLYRFESEGKLSFRRFAGRTLVESAGLATLIDAAEPWKASDRGTQARQSRAERSRENWRR